MGFIEFIQNNWQALFGAVSALLSAVIAIALLVPGEQPEKALKSVVAFLEKFSKK